MRRISQCLFMIILILITCNSFANKTKPGFVVAPYARSVTLAPNSTLNVLVVAQNMTGVSQTITNMVPQIPSDSGISGTVTANTCGLLSPGASCAALVKLQSGSQPSLGNLNISVCAFNGAFCSRIVKPIDFSNNQPVRIFVTPTNPSIANSTTKQFNAIGLFANSTIQDITDSVRWSSSNTSNATISNASGSQGLATAIAAGTSAISATIDGLSDSSILTVTSATLTSITITPTSPSVANGNTEQFTATGIFSDNSNQDLTSQVTWSSSNTAVATISNVSGQNGIATTKSLGSTTITATFGAISGSTTLHVTSAALTSISVTPTNPTSTIFTTQQFAATGLYSDNSVKDLTNNVTWSTQSALVAIISNQAGSKGKAEGVGVGSTSVIATLGGVTGSTNLQVTQAVLTGIDVTPINMNLPAGSQQLYTATGTYNNGHNQDITTSATWQSSDSTIATISNAPGSEGLAYGIQVGSVTISATSGNVVGSTHLTVANPVLQTITVTPTTPTIANGTEQQFTATGNYSDSSTQDLTSAATWISNTPSVAVISNAAGSYGLASTIATGSTSIIAIFKGVSGNTTLTVSAATLTSISVTPANTSIPNGTDEQFTSTGTYSDSSTKNITTETTWTTTNNSIATVSNAAGSQGLVTGVNAGATTINASFGGVIGGASLTVTSFNIGDNIEGGKIACLNGGLNNLIAANADNSPGLAWDSAGTGAITNAQSNVDGSANTIKIVNVLGVSTAYAARLCETYEIDSAGNTPCVGGNTCYNDWFLPAINQLSCLITNKNAIGGFNAVFYWSSTEYSSIPNFSAWFMSTYDGSQAAGNKIDPHAVRCVRLMNATP
ncbi:MAG: Ig-like domain-containing protein [Gammaproteobacteria bacterium]|nr:Ig-like domain-containing protein [Gammaproteobacteria bacterium]